MPRWFEWAMEKGLWVTLATAVLARLIYWFHIHAHDPLYAQPLAHCDMDTYWQWAKAIAAGDWLSEQSYPAPFYYGPLYAYFLAAIVRVFGANFHVVHGAQALVGLVAPVLLWSIGRRLFGKGPALATGLLAAVCAPFLFYEQTLLMEGLLIAIHAAILWCLVCGQEAGDGRAGGWALAAGALSALACWGRGNFLLVIPALAAVWLLVPTLLKSSCPTKSDLSDSSAPPQACPVRRGVICAATYLAGAALLLSVTLWRNHHVSGRWVLTTSNGPSLLYIGNASDSRGIYFFPPSFKVLEERYGTQAAVPWFRELLRDMTSHPVAFLGLLLKKTSMFWNSYDYADNLSYYLCKRYSWLLRVSPSTWLILMPLGLLGIWESRKSWRRQMFLYVYAVAFPFSIIIVFIIGRYRLEELLPMLIWAGPAVIGLANAAWERQWTGLGVRLLLLAAATALLWPTFSPAVAYNAPKKMPGVHLVRPNDYNRLALAHLELRQRSQARAIFEEAVSHYPYIDALVFPLSSLYIEDREPQNAVTILRRYLRTRGADKNGLLRLANALSLGNRTSEAIETVQEILRRHPNDSEAQALLLRIQSRRSAGAP